MRVAQDSFVGLLAGAALAAALATAGCSPIESNPAYRDAKEFIQNNYNGEQLGVYDISNSLNSDGHYSARLFVRGCKLVYVFLFDPKVRSENAIKMGPASLAYLIPLNSLDLSSISAHAIPHRVTLNDELDCATANEAGIPCRGSRITIQSRNNSRVFDEYLVNDNNPIQPIIDGNAFSILPNVDKHATGTPLAG